MDRLDKLTRQLTSYLEGLGDPKRPRPSGIKRKGLQRAAAIRAEPTPPPVLLDAPGPSQDAPEALEPEPVKSEEPPLTPDASRSIPCGYVLKPRPADWSAEAVTCGKLSSRWYCEVHHAEVFDNPINKVFNGRLQRQRH